MGHFANLISSYWDISDVKPGEMFPGSIPDKGRQMAEKKKIWDK